MIVPTWLNRTVSTFSILCLVLLGCLYDVTPVSAVSIVVDTLNDEEINDSLCSLREAIYAAVIGADYHGCTNGASAWVTLPAGNFIVDIGTLPSIENTSITVHGAGSSATVIQASDCNPIEDSCSTNHRLFYIASTGSLTLKNLTIRNGNVEDSYGGAIWNNGGSLSIYNSLITANRSWRGGALYNEGYIFITESTLSSNMVGIDDFGGAIYNFNPSYNANIIKSTFSNNSADYGGAIWSYGSEGGTLWIENCTFSSNTAGNYGGALVNSGNAFLLNNTFSENSALTGGGIYVAAGGTLTLANSIIANSPSGGDCAKHENGTIYYSNTSLIEDGKCNPGYSGDPSLSPLGNYGGPTQTHALLPGSIAIDGVGFFYCPNTDQRSIQRPQGTYCDIGSFEKEPDTLTYIPLFLR